MGLKNKQNQPIYLCHSLDGRHIVFIGDGKIISSLNSDGWLTFKIFKIQDSRLFIGQITCNNLIQVRCYISFSPRWFPPTVELHLDSRQSGVLGAREKFSSVQGLGDESITGIHFSHHTPGNTWPTKLIKNLDFSTSGADFRFGVAIR